MALDGGFLHNLINELNEKLSGARVDKIYEPSREELVLGIRPKTGGNQKLLISARGGAARVHITNHAPENPAQAPMFCMLLRKVIGGARLLSVTQPGLERLVCFNFESRSEMGDIIHPKLVVELITARENIILVDDQGRITDCIHRSDLEKQIRQVQPGAVYTLPESTHKISLLQDEKAAEDAVKAAGDRRLFEAILSFVQGVSPLVAREIALKCRNELDTPVKDVPTKMLSRALASLKSAQESGVPYLVKIDGAMKDYSYMPVLQYGNGSENVQLESFSELLDEFYYKRDNSERMRRNAQDILKLLTNLSERTKRKLAARKRDMAKCADREKYRIYGELLKANMYTLRRGDAVAEVVNYYDEQQCTVKIPLDTALSPADNAQKYFKNYKKLCTAEKTLQSLIEESENELNYIDSVFDLLSRAETAAQLAGVREELALCGYIKRQKGGRKQNTKTPPAVYRSPDGFQILAGRNNLQNDELTTKIAEKTDLWFHTKNVHGAHVILRLCGKEATEEAVTAAAKIAAFNSKAANSSGVAVDYTPVKYVKKPGGARPGMVIYKTNKTVYVTPNENEIEKLRG